MNDFDLDRLGDVWRQQPDPAEMARLQKSAVTVARRARIKQVTDVLAAIAVAGIVISLVANNPKPGTVIMGSAAILILLFGHIRLRRIRRIELGHLTGGTEDMIDQSIDRMETTLRHLRFSMIGFLPTVLVGALVAYLSQSRAILPPVQDSPLRNVLPSLGIVVVIGVMIFLVRAIRRGRRELERLRAMREAYRQEREPTGS